MVVEVRGSAFLGNSFVSAFFSNRGGGAPRFGSHGGELLLRGGVLCRVGGVP